MFREIYDLKKNDSCYFWVPPRIFKLQFNGVLKSFFSHLLSAYVYVIVTDLNDVAKVVAL